jgi:muramoyltetrapeptide carboxypeptidase LdcA involved in peptidoglycan recycling
MKQLAHQPDLSAVTSCCAPLTPGDRVAVISPSAGLPAVFPDVYELGLRRLCELFAVEPVEYPTTRAPAASAADRAADIMAAFTDPSISAVMASIGGDDQITVLRHLSRDVLAAHPKPFFGYSDNTNLLHLLFSAGVVGYHGGSVMVHLGRPGQPHPLSMESLRAALFGPSQYDLTCPAEFGDETAAWGAAPLPEPPVMRPAAPWRWSNADRVVDGVTWGGNLEVLSWLLEAGLVETVGSWRPDGMSRHGTVPAEVLFVETSEEMPSDTAVYRILRNMGERGLLGQFDAVLVGRAKAWSFDRPLPVPVRLAYADAQRTAVERALREYNPSALVVFDVDIGHTDPQLVIPYGGRVRVDGPARRVTVWY